MILELLPNVGSSLTLENDGASTGYSCRIIDLGNAVWNHTFSGPRGTQGALPAQGVPENRPFVFTMRVTGDGATAALAKASLSSRYSTLQKAADNLRRYGGRIRYRSNNQSASQYLRVMEAAYDLEEFTPAVEANNRATGALRATCAPYAEGHDGRVTDSFSSDSIADYTFDSGGGTIAVSGGQLVPSSTALKHFYRSAEGLEYSDVQTTLKLTTGATVPATSIGLSARRLDASNFVFAYVLPDSGNLLIAKFDGGTYSTLNTTAGGILATATSYWLRFRTEGNVLTAELFTAAPTPASTPVRTVTHTLSGGDITKFGTGIKGEVGIRLDGVPTDYRYDDFKIEPNVHAGKSLPTTISIGGSIAGDAPPLCEVAISTNGGAAAPVWALIAWWQRASTPLAGSVAPVGLIEAETGTSLSGWAVTVDADYRGGSGLQLTASGAGTSSATYTLDPSTIPRDEYTQGDLSIEVWARTELASSLVSPKLTLSVAPTGSGAPRYSDEWGSAGKLLTLPSSGTRFRPVRLGTITLVSDPSRPVKWDVTVAGSWAAGSSGTVGLDQLMVVPIRQRLAGPTSKPNDSNYPDWVPSTADWTKTIRSDGSGLRAAGAGNAAPDHGLGGVIELPYGNVDFLVALSSLVPDDPTSDATSEQAAHTGSTLQFSIVRRWAFLATE